MEIKPQLAAALRHEDRIDSFFFSEKQKTHQKNAQMLRSRCYAEHMWAFEDQLLVHL